MHVLTSLLIFVGFVLVICLGVVQVIWDLSETSTHASPQMLAMPPIVTRGPQDGEPTASESSGARDSRVLFIAVGYQLGVLVHIAIGKIERRFAIFADIPYLDCPSRQHWEQLWCAEFQ